MNYFSLAGGRADPVTNSHPNIWSEGSGQATRNGDILDTFDFLMKSNLIFVHKKNWFLIFYSILLSICIFSNEQNKS